MMVQKRNRRPKHEYHCIVGILDAQGFTTAENTFMFRELSIASKKYKNTLRFETSFREEICKNRKNLDNTEFDKWKEAQQYRKWKVHGLAYDNVENMPQQSAVNLITILFTGLKRCDCSKFGVSNRQLAGVLKQANIPFIDLTPTLMAMEEKGIHPNSFIQSSKPCSRHDIYFDGMQCSDQRSRGIWKWLQAYLSSLKNK